MPRRALIGPWGHNDPVHGAPGPAVGILGEFVRWWDRWLKGIENGIDDEPMVVAWMQGSVRPAANLAQRPGRWVAEERWPSPRIAWRSLRLGDGVLADDAGSGEGWLEVGSDQTRRARRRRLVRRREVGRPAARPARRGRPLALLHVRAARRAGRDPRIPRGAARAHAPTGRWRSSRPGCARCAPTATSLLVTRGQLNLCHRESHADPSRSRRARRWRSPWRWTRSRTGSRPAAASGSAVSPCYWPLAWPSPQEVTLRLRFGTGAELALPVRPPRPQDETMRQPDPPAEPEPLAGRDRALGLGRRAPDHPRPDQRPQRARVRLGSGRDRAAARTASSTGTPRSPATRSSTATRCRPGSR